MALACGPKKAVESSCHPPWICELGRLMWSQGPFALLPCDFWPGEPPPTANFKTLSLAVLEDPRARARHSLPSVLTFVLSVLSGETQLG